MKMKIKEKKKKKELVEKEHFLQVI